MTVRSLGGGVALIALVLLTGCGGGATSDVSPLPSSSELELDASTMSPAEMTLAYMQYQEAQKPLEDFKIVCALYSGIGMSEEPMIPQAQMAVDTMTESAASSIPGGQADDSTVRDFLRANCLNYQIKYYWDEQMDAASRAARCAEVDSAEFLAAMQELIDASNKSQDPFSTYTSTPLTMQAAWKQLCAAEGL